jgi:site-specific recombinase XerC
MRSFISWCAARDVRCVPAHPEVVLLYLRSLAMHRRALSTIEVTHSAILALHRAGNVAAPSSARLRAGLQAMRRSMAQPATTTLMDVAVLRVVIAACVDDPQAKRDRALLLVKFFGRLRRSETVALDIDSIHRQQGRLALQVPSLEAPLPLRVHGETNLCPVRALECWIAERAIHAKPPLSATSGPLFVAVHQGAKRTLHLGRRLLGEDVDRVLRRRAARAGLDANAYPSRTLRAEPELLDPRRAGGAR